MEKELGSWDFKEPGGGKNSKDKERNDKKSGAKRSIRSKEREFEKERNYWSKIFPEGGWGIIRRSEEKRHRKGNL